MLLVINDNVIEGVKINKNGYPVIPDLYTTSCTTHGWPYVYIKSVIPLRRNECELGYWDNKNYSKKICPIKFDNVSILSIVIGAEIETLLDRWQGISNETDNYILYYHYEITIELCKDTDSCNYTFKADDYKVINNGAIDCTKMNTMKRLFNKVIPMINNFISNGHPIQQLNIPYVQSWLPQKEDDYLERCYIHDYNRFKQIILSSKLENTQGNFILQIGRGLMLFVNSHISDIISNILGVRFLRDISNEYIYGDVTEIIKEINNVNLLFPYCLAKIFFNAERFYSCEQANKEIMFAPASDSDSIVTNFGFHDLYSPNLDTTNMFNFIYGIEAVHRIKGVYRAGRDDIEYEEKYIKFPINENYFPNNDLIQLINTVLNIKLECHKDIPKYFIFAIKGKSEYVPWLARDQDCGSKEFKETSLNKLLNKIYTIFKNNKKEFMILCREEQNSSA